jgi:hypothetical protein
MTTIAVDAKAGVMCCDSFWFDGDSCGVAKKIFRIKGDLYGGAGDSKGLAIWFHNYRKNLKLPNNDVAILRLSAAGISCWSSADGWHTIDQKQFAVGTGAQAARGAMAAGATCAKAVRLAADIVADTGGPVRTYKLKKGTE